MDPAPLPPDEEVAPPSEEPQGMTVDELLALITPRAWVTPAIAILIVFGFGAEVALGVSVAHPTKSVALVDFEGQLRASRVMSPFREALAFQNLVRFPTSLELIDLALPASSPTERSPSIRAKRPRYGPFARGSARASRPRVYPTRTTSRFPSRTSRPSVPSSIAFFANATQTGKFACLVTSATATSTST